ncbi:hypothetical protein AXX17_AT1G50020 [Arabidopsis thaliana]|uniref:Uncharacterized protein n=1 Tax=Arabidopsis thaliana TaxID=3702 RepID=A0A178W6E4_ARATH|nr:hypothetical protein AXX17_AT1G50020 [Arabidopsis thaliana]
MSWLHSIETSKAKTISHTIKSAIPFVSTYHLECPSLCTMKITFRANQPRVTIIVNNFNFITIITYFEYMAGLHVHIFSK